MRGSYKAACNLIGLIGVYAISTFGGIGCNNNEISKLDSQPQKVAKPQKVATYHNQTSQLAEKVVELSSDVFSGPFGVYNGALCIGKDQKGTNRYVVIETLRTNENKMLDITVYSDLDLKVEAEVNKHLLNNSYSSAEKVLSKTKGAIIQFFDPGANGLTITHINDVFGTRNEKGEYAQVSGSELSEGELRKVNNVYSSILKEIEPVLEEELKARGERGKKLEQRLREDIAARKRQREETREQRVKTTMHNLTEFGH